MKRGLFSIKPAFSLTATGVVRWMSVAAGPAHVAACRIYGLGTSNIY
jgi:hypothetical protein